MMDEGIELALAYGTMHMCMLMLIVYLFFFQGEFRTNHWWISGLLSWLSIIGSSKIHNLCSAYNEYLLKCKIAFSLMSSE